MLTAAQKRSIAKNKSCKNIYDPIFVNFMDDLKIPDKHFVKHELRQWLENGWAYDDYKLMLPIADNVYFRCSTYHDGTLGSIYYINDNLHIGYYREFRGNTGFNLAMFTDKLKRCAKKIDEYYQYSVSEECTMIRCKQGKTEELRTAILQSYVPEDIKKHWHISVNAPMMSSLKTQSFINLVADRFGAEYVFMFPLDVTAQDCEETWEYLRTAYKYIEQKKPGNLCYLKLNQSVSPRVCKQELTKYFENLREKDGHK
ncbi:MAG: hypothetical protein MJZ34_14470 [Paludibacteraceae bacterium]|nr:hypothetical protein [Paludibacteraceae bacterium]